MIQRNFKIFKFLETQSVVAEPAASAIPGSLLEIQKLRSHPKFTGSESVFQQGPQVNNMYIKV